MSCNGCRILRRGCTEHCILRPCLEWIERPQAQANATLFVSKFFGRSDLMSFISAVPENKRPALFQSLLFEACGRAVNPVSGAVGLLSAGNWHICQAAVETVLAGGTLQPMPIGVLPSNAEQESEEFGFISLQSSSNQKRILRGISIGGESRPLSDSGSWNCMENTASMVSEISEIWPEFGGSGNGVKRVGSKEPKLLNLFA
ncbi:hypothetical protein CDL12_05182 [Handroanthus impetiginosus]|uniref:LOB domain-containing protein n=1 Tax=Handroanthus impetiginosus TaxID=429701 RepID=A0A2G9HX53_9LAMI|nr:hypothetical protein CDL12_05182 [Handroanthus impetiginosus]